LTVGLIAIRNFDHASLPIGLYMFDKKITLRAVMLVAAIACIQFPGRVKATTEFTVFAKLGDWTIIQGGGECQAAITNAQDHALYLRQIRGEENTTVMFTIPSRASNVAVGSNYNVRFTTSARLLKKRYGDLYRFVAQKGPLDTLLAANIGASMMDEIKSSTFLAFNVENYGGVTFKLDRSSDAIKRLSECVNRQ
jgi:hypothetical protein